MTLSFYVGCGFQAPGDTVAIARQAEHLGYHGVTIPDHLFYPVESSTPYPYSDSGAPPFPLDAPWPDVWVLVGALGAITTRIHFRTNVYVLPLRHPLVVARAVGTAAVMAEGRVELGIGVGHLKDEFDALGADFRTRGRRTDDSILALRALLQPGPVSYRGEIWDIQPIFLEPAPEQPVPILVGGESKAALERTARLGDGHVSLPHTMDDLELLMAELKKLRADLAPEMAPLRFHVECVDAQSADDYRRLVDAGVEVVKVAPWRRGSGPVPLDERLKGMEEFAASVVEKV